MFSTLAILFLTTMGVLPSDNNTRVERNLLQGSWTMEAMQDNGDTYSAQMIEQKLAKNGRVEIDGKLIKFISPATGQEKSFAFRLDVSKSPKVIELINDADQLLKGIFRFDGDRLILCVRELSDGESPVAFEAFEGSRNLMITLAMVPSEVIQKEKQGAEEAETRRKAAVQAAEEAEARRKAAVQAAEEAETRHKAALEAAALEERAREAAEEENMKRQAEQRQRTALLVARRAEEDQAAAMRRAQEAEQERIAQLAREQAEVAAKARQLAEEEARRKEAAAAKDLQVRNMLIGSWTYTDGQGKVTTILYKDGTFSSTRDWAKTSNNLFLGATKSAGSWQFDRGVITSKVDRSSDPNTVGQVMSTRVHSIGDSSVTFIDMVGRIQHGTRVR